MRKFVLLTIVSVAIFMVSCDKDDQEDSEVSGRSHNAGKNCMSCHKDFKLAGSVYKNSLSEISTGATIKVTTEANGQGSVLATLKSDNSGNFYTESSVSFGSGVYVSATGASGSVNYMSSAITGGACNSCHGSSTAKISAE